MKTLSAFLVGLALAVSTQAAELQPRAGFAVSGSFGVNAPTGEEAHFSGRRSGAGFSLAGDYSPRRWFSLGVASGYSAPATDSSGEFHDTTVYLAGFAQLNAHLGGWRPFLQTGVGHYKFRSNDTSGAFAGLGIEVPVARDWFVPLTVRYHQVRTIHEQDPDFVEWRIGITRRLGR